MTLKRGAAGFKPRVIRSALVCASWEGRNRLGETRYYREWQFALKWALGLIAVLLLLTIPVMAQVLPDAPSHSRTIPHDEQVSWWAFTAVDVAATVADAAVSNRAHFQPGIGHCHEGNPLFGGPYPSARRVWAQQMAGVAGLTALTWWLKKRRHPWWGVLTFADATIHTVATANTASNCF